MGVTPPNSGRRKRLWQLISIRIPYRNLKPISVDAVKGEVNGLLIGGEEVVMAFQTVRDQLIFTNKRIIAVDVQGITGKREILSAPCPIPKIQYFFHPDPRLCGADSGFRAVYHVLQYLYRKV